METTEDFLDFMEADINDVEVHKITDRKGKTIIITVVKDHPKSEPLGSLKRSQPRRHSDEEEGNKRVRVDKKHGEWGPGGISNENFWRGRGRWSNDRYLKNKRASSDHGGDTRAGDWDEMKRTLRRLYYEGECAIEEQKRSRVVAKDVAAPLMKDGAKTRWR